MTLLVGSIFILGLAPYLLSQIIEEIALVKLCSITPVRLSSRWGTQVCTLQQIMKVCTRNSVGCVLKMHMNHQEKQQEYIVGR